MSISFNSEENPSARSAYSTRIIVLIESFTHHKVPDDHCQQKERNTNDSGAQHAVPHGLNPLAAQDAEDDHERVEKVGEVPARNGRKVLLGVVAAVQLHSHHSEYEDDYGQHDAEVA